MSWISAEIPYRDHVVVDLLQFLLGGLHGVGRGIELVGLEALIGEAHGEGLILLLFAVSRCPRDVQEASKAANWGSTYMGNAGLSLRRGGIGGDGATGERSKSLAAQGRSLTSPDAREHGD